jgi:hypothetical protein
MSTAAVAQGALAQDRRRKATLTEPAYVRWTLIAIALGFFTLFLAVPLFAVFLEAFRGGLATYTSAATDPDALAALQLTVTTLVLAVPANLLFGLCAAWAIAKFRFRGKQVLITLIDVPLAVSPVISGLIFVLLAGRQGLFGPWLEAHDIQIAFAVPGIVLAGRKRSQDVFPHHPAEHSLGRGVRRRPVQRARDRRVRRSFRNIGSHQRPDKYAAVAHRNSLQRIPVSGGVCRCVDADRSRCRHTDCEGVAGTQGPLTEE